MASVAGCTDEEPDDFEEGNGGGQNGTQTGGPETDTSDGSDADLELLSHELVREDEGTGYESVKVVGKLENVSGERQDYVQVKVKFYNEDGELMDSSLDNVEDLDDGETWNFEVLYLGTGEEARNIDDYEIQASTTPS